ncbi:MAG: hypothetical protein O7C69_08535, partial [Gammaproteobacteria bacterium]|nr:hypothetical protein [Gammaproteobacteria bacterium]
MAIRYLLRSAAISLMIAIAFSTLQVAQAAAPDSQPIVEQGDTVGNLNSNTANLENNLAATTKFQALATSGQYSDAMGLVSHILDQGSEYGAETRASLVEPLMKLAMVQKQSGDYLPATQAGELAIDLIERNGGVFDPALVEPLVFLAQLEQDNGNHPAALERLYRAQHILHRTDGVMTDLQLPILAYMTKSYTAMKQTENTNTMIEQAFAIKSRDLDQNSIEYVPVVLEQAEIRAFNGQFLKARELIYFAMEILDQSLAENDPGFVDALNGLASVRYQEQASRREKPKLVASRLLAPRIRFPTPTII